MIGLPSLSAVTPAPTATDSTLADGVCKVCRTPPAAPPAAGVLYLATPAGGPLASLRGLLAALGVGHAEPEPGLLAVPLTPDLLDRLAADAGGWLTPILAQGTRALVIPDGRPPTVADLMNTQPLSTLLALSRTRWLADVLRDDRLETHFQPIVAARHPTQLFAYECLVRGRDAAGGLVPPRELFAAARTADLLFHLDRQARLCHIRCAARQRVPAGVKLFLNFDPSSIYSPAFCLRTTFRAVEEVGIDPARIVFEVVETEEVEDTNHLLGILEVYRAAGFGVALDDVGAGYNSLNLMAKLRPDYIKLDIGLTRGVDADPYKHQITTKLVEMAHELGVKTVVEGVETAGELLWAGDAGADYVQGYHIARPAAVPPDPAAGFGEG